MKKMITEIVKVKLANNKIKNRVITKKLAGAILNKTKSTAPQSNIIKINIEYKKLGIG